MKILKIILVLAIIGVAGFLYYTRPVTAPTEDISKQVIPVEKDNNVSTTSDLASPTVYTISQPDSKISFTINEELNGKPKTVVGTSSAIAGEMSVKDGKLTIGTLKIDATTFVTDSEKRDGAIVHMILKSDKEENHYITFTPTQKEIEITPNKEIKLAGNLTISGVTKPAEFTVTAVEKDGVISGTTTTKLSRKDFGLVIPNIPFVANVTDEFSIKADIVAKKK